jgi:hypothetical protein
MTPPQKIQNPDYSKLGMIAFEDAIRSKIGSVVELDTLEQIPIAVERLSKAGIVNADFHTHVYNIGNSGSVGAKKVLEILSKIKG